MAHAKQRQSVHSFQLAWQLLPPTAPSQDRTAPPKRGTCCRHSHLAGNVGKSVSCRYGHLILTVACSQQELTLLQQNLIKYMKNVWTGTHTVLQLFYDSVPYLYTFNPPSCKTHSSIFEVQIIFKVLFNV